MDAYLAGDPVSNNALFHHLYPEYGQQWREDKLAELFDWVPVDLESLKAYVVWLETQSQLIKDAKKVTALRQSLTILGVAAGVILPFCRGLRSRNVMQPWPVAALV
jgi:hypothetical protein